MSNHTAIVTGGASGIGEAIARRLAADGNMVAIFDLNGDAARSVAASIEKIGGKAIGLSVDVADRASIDSGVAETKARLGRPVILVNNAGVAPDRPFLEIDSETWQLALNVNLTGTFDCCQAVLPEMIEEGWGRIVNITSSSTHSGVPTLGAYVAAKSGVVGLTKVLALEFAKNGITVNSIPPGFIDTPMHKKGIERGLIDLDLQLSKTPVGRIGRPQDIAGACAFLVSDEGSYITGQSINVNGGRNT
jgi:2-hydroxycyclohexanecarboxyl-CoA dehydrogenase